MDKLSENLIFHVMKYIPSLSQLSSFGQTNVRIFKVYTDQIREDQLFRGIYYRMYYNRPCPSIGSSDKDVTASPIPYHNGSSWSWFKELRVKCNLGKLFSFPQQETRYSPRRRTRSSVPQTKRRNSVGVLSLSEENESAQYDDPIKEHLDGNIGYFGIETFSPSGDEWYFPSQPSLPPSPVAVWGDFYGIRVFDSLQDLLYEPGSSNFLDMDHTSSSSSTTQKYPSTPYVQSIGEDQAQVLSLITCNYCCNCERKGTNPKSTKKGLRPCLFLGFADGSVMAVIASLIPNASSPQYRYTTINASHNVSGQCPHTDEVTALCITTNEKRPMLLSAGLDGNVLLYPHAICCLDMKNSFICVKNLGLAPIYSLECMNGDEKGLVIFTGDETGLVNVWQPPNHSKKSHMPSELHSSFNAFTGSNILDGGAIVTQIIYTTNKYLISSNSNGELTIWETSWKEKSLIIHQKFRMHGDSECIEKMRVFGDILVCATSNAIMRAYDFKNWRLMGELDCGEVPASMTNDDLIRPSVVWCLLSGNSFVSVLRNGKLGFWDLETLGKPATSCDKLGLIASPSRNRKNIATVCDKQGLIISPSSDRKNAKRLKFSVYSPVSMGEQCNLSNGSGWNDFFQQLIQYKEEHGDCLVPQLHNSLGSWIKTQRQRYKKLMLKDDRREALNSIGMVWEVKEGTWQNYFEQLKQFEEEHGHCVVTKSHGSLGKWVSKQRERFRDSELSEGRQEALESIGFTWKVQRTWLDYFEELKQYKRDHGDCLVPTNHVSLGEWISYTRKRYRQSKIGKDRQEALENIGFVWKVDKRMVIKENKSFDARWNKFLEELKHYKDEHGDCHVPTSKGFLGKWVSHQRERYKESKMSKDRQQALENIGFVWNIKKTWNISFEELKKYKKEHGTCLVPRNQGPLGSWVYHQRQKYKYSNMEREQQEALEIIGFVWKLK